MADSPTTRKRLRKQTRGSNVDAWGDSNLNEVLDAVDQSMDGYLAIALTGDLTLTTSNYTTADQAKRRVHKFTGALSAAAAVTYPSVEGWYFVINAAGAAVTVKCSGGTGVTIPNGYVVLVYGDGTDLFAAGPQLINGALTVAGQIHGVSDPTANTDGANKTYVDTAVANAAIPAGSGAFFTSGSDTTAGFAAAKLSASGLLARATVTPGGNETSDFHATGYAATGTNDYAFTASPAPAARVAFETSYLVLFTNGNTKGCTLNDGLGAASLTKAGGAALAPGDIPPGAARLVIWDGTRFQVPVPLPSVHLPLAQAFAA